MRVALVLFVAMAVGVPIGWAAQPALEAPSGNYLEARSCDVYTGSCFANFEVNQTGKEAIMVWSIQEGAWKGEDLSGLTVIAVVRAQATLGDPMKSPYPAKSFVIVDEKATDAQREALLDYAKTRGDKLLADVVETKTAQISASIGNCAAKGCAMVEAKGLVRLQTRCLGNGDHVCGNEWTYYPPLTKVEDAYPAYTVQSQFEDDALGIRWNERDSRSAFLATFKG